MPSAGPTNCAVLKHYHLRGPAGYCITSRTWPADDPQSRRSIAKMNLQSRYGTAAQPRRSSRRTAPSVPFGARGLPTGRLPQQVKLVWIVWLILLFGPDYFLAWLGAPRPIVARIYFVPLGALAAYLLFQPGRIKHLAPFTAYACYVILTVPFAFIRGMAMPYAKLMIVTGIFSLALFTFVRHAAHVRFVLLTFLIYWFLWFAVNGIAIGRVPWHPLIGNQDQFGTIMAVGLVTAAAIAIGATERRLRRLAAFTALLCAGGLVSSFARGAFLAGGVALAFLWFRAEGRRLAHVMTIALVLGAVTVAGSFFSDVEVARGGGSRSFWAEISSIGESVSNPEEEERREVWRIGWRVFTDNPILGVGGQAWGAYAARTYHADTELLGERFSRNPNRLWGRALHNFLLEQLAEHGIIGTTLFLWMILDFGWKCRTVRRNSHKDDCSLLPGIRTRMIATAFEAGMVAALCAGLLYNILNFWLFAMIIVQALFYRTWADQRSSLSSGRLLATR